MNHNYLYGFLYEISPAITIPVIVLIILILGYKGSPFWMWILFVLLILWGFAAPLWLLILTVIIAIIFLIAEIRRPLVSKPIMNLLSGIMPSISQTERIALEAGTTWIEDEYFSGKPNFKRILEEPYPELSKEEKDFLNGPVNEICRMTNDWEVYTNQDLSAEVWEYIKSQKFFGMVIPKEYGGLGFSASAMNAVVAKLASRSIPLSVDVMVPNSLGPAELLKHYGTQQQKDYYLPRLATGVEIPCFALTEPNAGSDATSISSKGEVFKGEDGKLYLKLNWNKRYITLAAISTVLGLAFQLEDPHNLLGKGTHPGITCALIPTNLEGVILGKRHNPLNTPFINSPTEGHNVIVSVDQIIGGPEQAGNGWKMLMETLAGGRGIFLPALNNGGGMLAARIAGAYALIRQQFGISIGRFEGIEEALAPIGAFAYIQDALSRFTCAALDTGNKPAVISAIAKYNSTELNRIAINHAMDICGGKGIILGADNVLGHAYMAVPIGITVEGANIVTRSLIIFGQGLIRCHPFVLEELNSIQNKDVKTFDMIFWSHVGMVIRNFFRSFLLSLSRGYLSPAPVSGATSNYYRKLSWASASFALLADVSLLSLGGMLKLKESISGRFADALSWLYLGTCVLRRFEAEGRKQEDLPFVHWCMQYALSQIQKSIDGILLNFPLTFMRWLFAPIALWSRINPFSSLPTDNFTNKIAVALQTPGAQRDALTHLIYLPKDEENETLCKLEHAFHLAAQTEQITRKIKDAIKTKRLPKKKVQELYHEALHAGIISAEEHELLTEAEHARAEAVKVNAFDLNEMPVQLPKK